MGFMGELEILLNHRDTEAQRENEGSRMEGHYSCANCHAERSEASIMRSYRAIVKLSLYGSW